MSSVAVNVSSPIKIGAFAMRSSRSRTVSQRRLVWLLWLALLLPLAQAAAVWHVLSHTGPAANGEADGKRALHPTHCDLCLTAAAVSGGALRAEPLSLPSPSARHEVPQAVSGNVGPALLSRAYRSRAPPFAAH